MRRRRLPFTGRRSGPRRVIPAAALAGVLAATLLSACDASPYAASVGGTTIKSAQLNTELRWAAAAKDYSATLISFYANAYNGATLTQAGDSSNTYSSQWSAYVLSSMIQGEVVRQAVAATGGAPSSDLYAAALGGIEIENGGPTGSKNTGGVTQMNPSYLVDVTQRLADHAYLEKPLPSAQLQSLYNNYKAYFYTQVCVRQATVSVTNANGTINFSASQSQAQTVAQGYANNPTTSTGGAATCYTHEQVDALSPSMINTVVGLAPGHAAITKAPYGYQVLSVTSRQSQPLAGPVAQVLTTLAYDVDEPASDTVLRSLQARAKVRVNPTYGSWNPGSKTSAAGVVPPTASAATPVGSSTGSLTATALGS